MKNKFHLICNKRDKKCKHKAFERYMFYCSKLEQKLKYDNETKKQHVDKLNFFGKMTIPIVF